MHILNNNGAIYMTTDFNFNQALDNYYREVTAEVTASIAKKTLLDQQELNDKVFPSELPTINIDITECDLDELRSVIDGKGSVEWSYTDQYGQSILVNFVAAEDDEE
jgi:hypothetical protein